MATAHDHHGPVPSQAASYSSAFDTAVAAAVLAVADAVPAAGLGLDRRLLPVQGVLPAVTAARAAGSGTVVLAAQDAAGAAPVPGIGVIGQQPNEVALPRPLGCRSAQCAVTAYVQLEVVSADNG